ncbi:right-handed parallel beta-helix repeat-containing protein [Thermostilla marina]
MNTTVCRIASIAAVWLVALAIAHASEPTADLYVSPAGNDAWSGTLPLPNATKTDGPFATLGRAKSAVQKLRSHKSGNIVVLIREGVYRVERTIVFGVDDGGAPGQTITYAAYPGESPILSGGFPVTRWRRVDPESPGLLPAAAKHVWTADVSGSFFALFDDEGLLPRARSEGFIPLEGGSRNTLRFPDDRLKAWPNLGDVELVVRPYQAWIVNILPLASVDEHAGIARTAVSATYAMRPQHFLHDTQSCWVENALEFLDKPGEWVLDTSQHKLYLWPRHGERPENIVAPAVRELIRVEGKIDKDGPTDVPVRNLRFRGLTFMHGDRFCMTDRDAGLQHDWEMHDRDNALVRFRGTERCALEACRFRHTAGGAVRIDLYGQANTIAGNLIEHIGGTGILLCGYGPGTKDVNKNNVVFNNHIHHVGEIYPHSPGIFVWQSGNNRIANNLVHHTPYSGIIVSGCMSHFFAKPDDRELVRTIRRHELPELPVSPTYDDVKPFLHSRENQIEYNEIHHAMEQLGDGNGIYIRGAGPGNVIRRNFVHDLLAPMPMQAGIRTDGGQRDTLIAENVVYRCTSQGIILKLNNRCINNVVADVIAPPRGYYLALREGPLTGAVIRRNVFYCRQSECVFVDESPARRGQPSARLAEADADENVYYCMRDPHKGRTVIEQHRKIGVDLHSCADDPLFIDVDKSDFQFRPDSPALKMGIVPIDVSQIGLRSPVP